MTSDDRDGRVGGAFRDNICYDIHLLSWRDSKILELVMYTVS